MLIAVTALHNSGNRCKSKATLNRIIVASLTDKLLSNATEGTPISRDEFDRLVINWVMGLYAENKEEKIPLTASTTTQPPPSHFIKASISDLRLGENIPYPHRINSSRLEPIEATDLEQKGFRKITATFSQNQILWLTHKLPTHFEVRICVETKDNKSQFILGLGNSENWTPNYHFVMTPEWNAFKKVKEVSSKQNSDEYINFDNTYNKPPYLINPKQKLTITLRRRSNAISVLVCNHEVFNDSSNQYDYNEHNFLFVTSNSQVGTDYLPGTVFVKFEENGILALPC